MDKYVMAVLLLMPGFLTINTAEKLGKTHTKKTGVSLALEYATYTIVILLIAMGGEPAVGGRHDAAAGRQWRASAFILCGTRRSVADCQRCIRCSVVAFLV